MLMQPTQHQAEIEARPSPASRHRGEQVPDRFLQVAAVCRAVRKLVQAIGIKSPRGLDRGEPGFTLILTTHVGRFFWTVFGTFLLLVFGCQLSLAHFFSCGLGFGLGSHAQDRSRQLRPLHE
jgi:hypothetical protein